MSVTQKKFEGIALKVDAKFVGFSGGDRQEYLKGLIQVCDRMKDSEWDSLAEDEQAWYNAAAKSIKNEKEIADFPDYKAEVKSTREKIEVVEPVGLKPEDVKTGMVVDITLNDDSKVSGLVVEASTRFLTLETTSGKEEDIRVRDIKDIKEVEAVSTEVSSPAEEKVEKASKNGAILLAKDAVEGKKYTIEVEGDVIADCIFVRATGRGVVFEDSTDNRYRINADAAVEEMADSVAKVEKKVEEKKVDKKEESSKKVEVKEEPVAEKKKVSVIHRIRELCCKDTALSVAQIKEQLLTENLTCSEITLAGTYRDTHIIISLLK